MTQLLIAQISDLHVRPPGVLAYGVSETNICSERAVHALLRLDPRPDFVLVTGDLTDCGLDEEYAIVLALLARLPMPVFAVPGNHDRREAFRKFLAPQGYLPEEGTLNYAVWLGPICLIALDSVVPGASHGALAAETLDFLGDALAADPAAPTLVTLHHPPFETGIGHMDRAGLLEGREALERIVGASPQVQRILCGHIHRPIQRLFAGTLCQTAPSVAHQVAFDLTDDGPPCFVLEPPAFLLHRFDGRHVVTHTVMVERTPGPFPFILPDDYPGRALQSDEPPAAALPSARSPALPQPTSRQA